MLGTVRSWVKQRVIERVVARNERRRAAWGQERGLPPDLWDAAISAEGRLLLSGCDAVDLAERFGTPLHVVSKARLRADYDRFLESFRAFYPHVEVGYSYKTNPLPGVVRALHDFGALAEVISHFELWLALRLGVPPDHIIFNGPGKSREGIELAVARGIKLINVDGLDEIDVLAAAAAHHRRRQAVGVRIVTSVGWSAQFGLRLGTGEALEAFRRLRTTDGLIPIGLHMHLGTGIKHVPTYLQAIREMLEFARHLETEEGIRIGYLDFGGGFGVPTVQALSTWDNRLMQNNLPVGPVDLAATPTPADYARPIADLLQQYYPPASAERPTIAFEPGRAVTSNAQSLLLRVVAVKAGRDGITRVILNGGKNVAFPTWYEYHELFPASRMRAPHAGRYNFYGPLCHPGDVLFVQKPFPRPEVGDVVAIMDSGAYFVPNQMNFSNPRAAAVMVVDGDAELIRSRETFEDVVHLDPVAASAEPATPLATGKGRRRASGR